MVECPNIVLIMTDQQRFDTIGAWGYDYMTTPALDRLAGEGLSFRRAFCPGATCVASRAAIFTGMYPHNTGVYSFDHWADHRNWVQDLNDAGYHCVNMGKMHFSPRDVSGGFHERVIVENPTSKHLDLGGADDDWGRFLRIHDQQRPNDRNKTDPAWLEKYQGVPWHLEERFHSDVFIGDSALSWIRDYRGRGPFFLQVGFTGPHEPWDPLARHLDLYEGREMPPRIFREGELEDKPPQHAAHKEMHATTEHESVIDMYSPSEEDIARMRRHYYAKITTVDEQLGQIVEALEERGLLDRTLIVLASEFSRDMMMEGRPEKKVRDQVQVPPVINELKFYGMHRHFTGAGSVLMFGGGLKRGHLHGVTADERPCTTIKDRVVIEDLHATIYRALGISPRHAYEIEGRPFYVTRDGEGQSIDSLFA